MNATSRPSGPPRIGMGRSRPIEILLSAGSDAVGYVTAMTGGVGGLLCMQYSAARDCRSHWPLATSRRDTIALAARMTRAPSTRARGGCTRDTLSRFSHDRHASRTALRSGWSGKGGVSLSPLANHTNGTPQQGKAMNETQLARGHTTVQRLSTPTPWTWPDPSRHFRSWQLLLCSVGSKRGRQRGRVSQ